jgi:hypothetical protein
MALTKNPGGGRDNLDVSSAQVAATGANASDVFPCSNYIKGSFQCVWASITGTFTAELQGSNDGTNWATITGTSFVSSGTAGNQLVENAELLSNYYRIKITSPAGAGTLDVRAALKKG